MTKSTTAQPQTNAVLENLSWRSMRRLLRLLRRRVCQLLPQDPVTTYFRAAAGRCPLVAVVRLIELGEVVVTPFTCLGAYLAQRRGPRGAVVAVWLYFRQPAIALTRVSRGPPRSWLEGGGAVAAPPPPLLNGGLARRGRMRADHHHIVALIGRRSCAPAAARSPRPRRCPA